MSAPTLDKRVSAIAAVSCGGSFVGEHRAKRIIEADPLTKQVKELAYLAEQLLDAYEGGWKVDVAKTRSAITAVLGGKA